MELDLKIYNMWMNGDKSNGIWILAVTEVTILVLKFVNFFICKIFHTASRFILIPFKLLTQFTALSNFYSFASTWHSRRLLVYKQFFLNKIQRCIQSYYLNIRCTLNCTCTLTVTYSTHFV